MTRLKGSPSSVCLESGRSPAERRTELNQVPDSNPATHCTRTTSSRRHWSPRSWSPLPMNTAGKPATRCGPEPADTQGAGTPDSGDNREYSTPIPPRTRDVANKEELHMQ